MSAAGTMLTLLNSLRDCLRSHAVLQAEIIALRHQLSVPHRCRRGQRLRLRVADRLFWVWLSRIWADWRSALLVVKPETVIAWHRMGFRLYWRWKSHHREGRPSVPKDVRDLIRRMSLANPRWGAPRIHGELLNLGLELSQATVANYMVRQRRPPWPSGTVPTERPTDRDRWLTCRAHKRSPTIRRRRVPAHTDAGRCRSGS